MDGKLRGLWWITECPFCNSPAVTSKVVIDGAVIKPMEPKYITCPQCDGGYFVELKEMECDLHSV